MGIYLRKNSPYFWMAFKFPGKKQIRISTGTADKKLAQKIYIAKRSEYQKVDYEFEREKIKLKDLMNKYLEIYYKPSRESNKNAIYIVKKIHEFFGEVFVNEVSVDKIEEYRAKRLGDGVKQSTVNRECSLLKSIFNRGIEWGKCKENPVSKIKFYSEKEFRRTKFLDKNEKIKLLNGCSLTVKRIVLTALLTGMREGELLNLKWSEIDFNTRLIKISHSKGKKIRHVPMNSELENVLKSIPSVSDYVFGTQKGKAKFSLYRKPFEKAVEQSEIKDCVFHTLRHTFASDLIMKGVDLKTVAELLGHSTTVMTERYSHLSKEHRQMAVDLLPNIFYHTGITLPIFESKENTKSS